MADTPGADAAGDGLAPWQVAAGGGGWGECWCGAASPCGRKAQNRSNNAAVTAEWGDNGRARAVPARGQARVG